MFSNISACQMMNFIQSHCVTLKNKDHPTHFLSLALEKNQEFEAYTYLVIIIFFSSFHFFLYRVHFISLHFAVIEEALTVARLHIYIRVQTVNSFFSGEAERSCKNGDHMLTECMI